MKVLKRHPRIIMGLAGLLVSLVFFLMWQMQWSFFGLKDALDTLEYKLYDVRMGFMGDPDSPSDIVIVDIDEESIRELGRWPWPRDIMARGIAKIESGQPKVIGLHILYTEPEENSGLKVIDQTKILFQESGLANSGGSDTFLNSLDILRQEYDNDTKLAEALTNSGKVILPMVAFAGVKPDNEEMAAMLGPLEGRTIPMENVSKIPGIRYPAVSAVLLPISQLLLKAQGIGHISLAYDPDGKARRENILYKFGDNFLPSYTLLLAAHAKGLNREDIKARIGESLTLGDSTIPINNLAEFLIVYKGKEKAFKTYSFYNLLTGETPTSVFKDKVVMVSVSAKAVIQPINTPVNADMPMGEFQAQIVWSLLGSKFIHEPAWNNSLILYTILFLALVLGLAFPRLKALVAGMVFILLLALLFSGSTYLFVNKGLWIKATYPMVQLIVGYIVLTTLKFFVTEARKEVVEGESAETNRMLGLSFQSQGMLDMAFDKFRKVPVDKGMKDILYNLALDYERKRQFNKAVSVYDYIMETDAKFKDVKDRRSKMMQVGETMILGTGALGGDILAGGADTKPTLGRYEVVKQLGKGAMGIVYLGKDPRINRTTAIKTFQFTEDLEPDQVAQMKEKFFQEAESAGTLAHPNIVTIYDAGEEQELAYIAMEYLEGEDLKRYAKKGQLFPVRKVIDYVADVAGGLEYAHNKGIVHRDIKPANLMLLKNGIIKITDFGIARITATSQTQTGVVKGTPHYMSPEQISGKKVDGRSDLFSLGIVLFQLLTGELPFEGDNVAALMHQIMNEPHPDPRKLNAKIPKYLAIIINKALEKNRDKRYQSAAQMESDLRKVGAWYDSMLAKKKEDLDNANNGS